MSTTTQNPKVFISYSWSGTEHEQFVLELATTLRNHGVDAKLDKWDLKPGQDKFAFMETMVTDPEISKVLVICDRVYKSKADSRKGGVGTESQIISAEVYGKVTQTKFIPLVREYDDAGKPCLPVFMTSLIFIDFSTDDVFGDSLEHLLRLLYEQPLHERPALGTAPSFLREGNSSQVRELSAALRAIQDGRPNRQGVENLFVRGVLTELQRRHVTPTGDDYHEGIYQAIVGTKDLRDQVADYVDAVAGFSVDDGTSLGSFIKLMEGIGANFGPPEGSGQFYPGWTDFWSFFALEALLIATACLIRHERWISLRRLLDAVYIVRGEQREPKATSFISFDSYMRAMDEHRNHKLRLNRISLTADMLKERCSSDRVSFTEMLQADVFLTLKSVVASVPTTGQYSVFWAPRTTVYSSHANRFPLFMRAADEETRTGIYKALGVKSAVELKAKLESASNASNSFQRFRMGAFHEFNFLAAINVNELLKETR